MSEEVVKRPKKDLTVNFVLAQYGVLKANIPGITQATVSAQLKHGGYYLYESEVEELIKQQTEKLGEGKFDGDFLKLMLLEAGAIKQGERPAFGGRQGERSVRINSMERALEVVNDPNDAPLVVEIMTEMIKLREKINPLINKKATCSIALKNEKPEEPKDNKVAEESADLSK